MKATRTAFRISAEDEHTYDMVCFVAEKSFRVGYRKGMVAVLDAFNEWKAGQEESK